MALGFSLFDGAGMVFFRQFPY